MAQEGFTEVVAFGETERCVLSEEWPRERPWGRRLNQAWHCHLCHHSRSPTAGRGSPQACRFSLFYCVTNESLYPAAQSYTWFPLMSLVPPESPSPPLACPPRYLCITVTSQQVSEERSRTMRFVGILINSSDLVLLFFIFLGLNVRNAVCVWRGGF